VSSKKAHIRKATAMPVPARTATTPRPATARAAGALTTLAFTTALAIAAPASGAAATSCTGPHSMMMLICPDGTGVGYTCDTTTGRWVRESCPAAAYRVS
jgi:hypothetical protein